MVRIQLPRPTARWSRGLDTALSRRYHEFDSRPGHHVVADFTCSRRRFLFLKKRATPVAVPAFFGARSARLKNSTAATRSPPFFRHRRRSARSPFRRDSSSEKRPFPPPRGFRPAGGVLFLFSPMLASLAKGQGLFTAYRRESCGNGGKKALNKPRLHDILFVQYQAATRGA